MDLFLTPWLLGLIAIVYCIYKLGTWNYNHFTKLNIPFLKPVPFLGNMGPFVFRKRSFGDQFEYIYKKYKGSAFIGFFQFFTPTLIICDPELIKMVTVKDFEYFTDHVTPLREDDDPLFGKFLFALQGDRWRNMRNTLSPAFTSSKMKAMFLLVSECGEQLGEYLEKRVKDSGGVLSLEMKDLFTRYANDVIATSAFGIHCDSLQEPTNEFYMMGKDATNFGGTQALKFLGFQLSPALMRFFNIKFVREHVNKFFKELVSDTLLMREKEHIIRPDMIHLLMQARKGTLKTETTDESEQKLDSKRKAAELSDEDITAQVFLFFVAGFDTASTHLCFLSHLLAVNPDIQKRVQAEIDEILREDGGKITYEGVHRMKYTDMCINETLRMWPPAVVTDRKCVKPYTFPATANSPSIKMNVGDYLMIPVIAIHRDPKYFDDPDKFDPERFNDENKHKINPFAYMPFGAGPRVCIGMRFALMETKIALMCILSRFNFKTTSKTPKKLILNKDTFNMGVEGGFWLGLEARTKAQ